MCHIEDLDPSIFSVLLSIDQELSQQVRSQGCEVCGSPLHQSHYARQPRGLPSNLPELQAAYSQRYSFCCSHRECRKRHTPVSVRFLGQKVYVGFIFTLVSALIYGLTPTRQRTLLSQTGIPRQTLHRWVKWWRKEFVRTKVWKRLKMHLMAIDCDPVAILSLLKGRTFIARIVRLLKLLLPLTTKSSSNIPEIDLPQNL